jgi:feruloyl esterase
MDPLQNLEERRMRHRQLSSSFLLIVILVSFGAITFAEDSCDKLNAAAITGAKVIFAGAVAAGKFAGPSTSPGDRDLTAPYKNVPAFCRVVVLAKPAADSEIKIEVWLPAAGWNGKLQGLANGGFAGMINYPEVAASVSQGYAAAATDTGHAGSPIDASWALGHPEKVIDFGHRGIHEMTRVAKDVVQAFYGKAAQRAYFAGCSDGGREALMEAQRYPADYDGILAGAPANNWTPLLSMAVSDTQALTLDPGSFIPPTKVPAISAAVLAACDELDGVRDGILNDPRQCHFNPSTMQCKAGEDTDKCLTASQATALKKIYTGLRDSHDHELFPGFLPGAEDGPGGWALWITGRAPAKSLIAFFGLGFFSNMVYENAAWDYRTFTVEAGLKSAQEKTANALNAVDANLKPFQARGGKLILYHGWNDPAIPALSTVNYYDSVVAKMGQRDVDSFLRLYMVPGMQHCDNGPGADSFGQVGRLGADDPQHSVDATLEQWVEKGTAPATIIASKSPGGDHDHAKLTRPLCAYPQSAKYKGSGDPNEAANFVCETGKK